MRERLAVAGVAVALCGLALVFRTGILTKPPIFDELYHLLAARGWLETGQPVILDGEYVRTRWFTYAVAKLFEFTGSDSLAVGRLVSLVAGILIPPVLFLWIRGAIAGRAGWDIGLIAAALAILWPQGIEEAQTLRFYSWQALAFTLGAIAVFQAVGASGRDRVFWTATAVLALTLALYLQLTTAFGLLAILVWLGCLALVRLLAPYRRRGAILAGLAAAGLALAGLAIWSGALDDAWARYRWAAGHAQDRQSVVTYYHTFLREAYPTFWPLFPVAAIVAAASRPRLAIYCLVLFGVTFVLLSLGGMKAERYLSYIMPFFFAVMAIGLYETVPALFAVTGGLARRANPTGIGWMAPAAIGVALFFAALANPFFERSVDVRGKIEAGRLAPNWMTAPELLGDWIPTPFLMTTDDLRTIAYVGDYDLLFNESRLSELPDPEPFAEDFRTGRPVIGDYGSFLAVLECHPEGVLLIDSYWWDRNDWAIKMMPLFSQAGLRFEARANRHLKAIRWFGGTASDTACERIPLARLR